MDEMTDQWPYCLDDSGRLRGGQRNPRGTEGALSDAAIERKSREVVETDERFRAARALIRVNNGEVFLTGSFLGFRDPSILKHKVADIEGVVGIGVGAAFVARPSET